MAGKTNKTRVTLPGSLADLVRDLQDGGNASAKTMQQSPADKKDEKETDNKDGNEASVKGSPAVAQASDTTAQSADNQEDQEENAPKDDRAQEETIVERTNRPIGAEHHREGADDRQQRGRPQKENTMREYHVQKDDSADSWDLFLDLAKQYKTGGGRPATIYIDPALKNILDRLKYPLSLTTSAILSSIVARFIYDHEDDVRKAIFSQNIF